MATGRGSEGTYDVPETRTSISGDGNSHSIAVPHESSIWIWYALVPPTVVHLNSGMRARADQTLPVVEAVTGSNGTGGAGGSPSQAARAAVRQMRLGQRITVF